MISHVLIWGAAGGLLLAAFDPALGELTNGDAPAIRTASGRSASNPAAGNGIVRTQPSADPALMHRKQQGDGGGDLPCLRPDSPTGEILIIALPGGLSPAHWLRDGSSSLPGRNPPLRL